MRKIVRMTLVAGGVMSAFGAQAEQGWRGLPYREDGFRFQPSLALTGSQFNPRRGPLGNAWGVDLNFNCALLQSPANRIRTHIQISRSKRDGVTVMSYELSPRYTVPLNYGFSVGAGPSVATLRVSARDSGADLVAVGVAAGVNLRIGDYYAGMDFRAHDTNSRHGVNYDSFTYGFKTGVNF